MEIQGTSLAGIQGAMDSMAIRGRNIANVNTPGYGASDVVVSEGKTFPRSASTPSPTAVSRPADRESSLPNNVDLAKDMVGMRTDRASAGYNIKALKIQNRLDGTLMDLVG